MAFQARAASQLAPGNHLIIDGFPGLRLGATASRKSWIYRYKSPVDGRMRQTKLGEWPSMSIALAISAWEAERAKREGGNDPALEKRKARHAEPVHTPETYTVRQLCRDYLAGYVEHHRSAKSADEVRRRFLGMLDPIANLPAASITRRQAYALLESNRHSPAQTAKLRAELGAAWDYALDSGRVEDDVPNWWRQIMRGKLKTKGKKLRGKRVTTKRVLNESELGELIRWMPNFGENVADALTLYLWTGTRGSEIVSMEGSEISREPDGVWWTIPKAKTKNRHHPDATDLRVPLLGRALTVVERRLDAYGIDWLFPGKRGHLAQSVVGEGVYFYQPYCEENPTSIRDRLPVTHWAPHDLRRSVRTLLASMDCPGEIAEAIIGHMKSGVEGAYNRHRYDRQRRDWLTLLSARLEDLAAS